jgi:hypothetical protein
MFEALRGGNFREGGKDAVAGETYSDIPAHLVDDLVARRALKPLTPAVEPTKEELLTRAKELGVERPSTKTKDKLAAAVAEKQEEVSSGDA